MFYYLMIAFLIFVAFAFHIIIAHITDHLIEDIDNSGWYKPSYRKYLIIPGVPELILAILMISIFGVITYAYVVDLFKD